MPQKKDSRIVKRNSLGCLVGVGLLNLLLGVPFYFAVNLGYSETKGPYKNWHQVVDLDGDGDPDVLVSHTRWERDDISWAGVGRWINQGNRQFMLATNEESNRFAGFAGAAGDINQDGDQDVFVQEFTIRLLQNQGRRQGSTAGQFLTSGGIDPPPAYDEGYRDMGGTILTGDLNGDGLVDAFIAGCCYGSDPAKKGTSYPYAPSVSWVWINDGRPDNIQKGHPLPLSFLDGLPVQQSALGDLDGDGDLDVLAAIGKPNLGKLTTFGDLILFNDGTGNLAAAGGRLGDTASTSVALGDVSGDGRLDALVGKENGAALWLNQGNQDGLPRFTLAGQTFTPYHTVWDAMKAAFSGLAGKLFGIYITFGNPRTQSVSLADLDGDKDLDALVGGLRNAEIWWNDGTGSFTRSNLLGLQYPEDSGLAVGDFDNNGTLDIFAAGNGPEYQVWWDSKP